MKPHRHYTIWLILLLLFAIIGSVDSFLFHLKELSSKTNPDAFASCSLNAVINCATVAASKYANFWGIPVSLLGLFFFKAAGYIALFGLLGFSYNRWQRQLISLVAVVGLIFSLRLLYYSYFGLGSVCPYCLVTNLSTIIVVLSWFMALRVQPLPKN